MSEKIKVGKGTLVFVVAIAVITLVILLAGEFNFGSIVLQKESPPNVEELEAKFAVLSKANTNSCGGTFDYVDSLSDDARIQGSCCSSMNFHRYVEQIEGLTKYSKYEKIPSDPYDVPVSLANELLDYQKEIQLDSEQQEIYDEAVSLSHEGGPCCCKCWHWYAYEGLAKHLIVEEGFTAEQIAEVWDLSDACGGSGHIEGVEGH